MSVFKIYLNLKSVYLLNRTKCGESWGGVTSLLHRIHRYVPLLRGRFSSSLVWGERVIVLSSLVYPYFKLDIKQDEIRKALLIKQETRLIE